jgi:hypothetical protein
LAAEGELDPASALFCRLDRISMKASPATHTTIRTNTKISSAVTLVLLERTNDAGYQPACREAPDVLENAERVKG